MDLVFSFADRISVLVGGALLVEGPPDEVARRVARAIERKDLYILTHPEQREFLRRRAAKIDAMFEPGAW